MNFQFLMKKKNTNIIEDYMRAKQNKNKWL